MTHRLMFELMVRTGLRQIECRTFPEKYLFDPRRRPDVVAGQKIRVALNPKDMKLKFDRPREIDVPYDLMENLWWYAARHRQKRENNQRNGKKYSVLFLTEVGELYGDTALTQIFASLSKRVGFSGARHRSCSESKQLAIDPLSDSMITIRLFPLEVLRWRDHSNS